MLIVEEGWTTRRAGQRFQVSPATASKWATRYRAGDLLTDRFSRPHRSFNRLSLRREQRALMLRCTRRWGPHRISYHLGSRGAHRPPSAMRRPHLVSWYMWISKNWAWFPKVVATENSGWPGAKTTGTVTRTAVTLTCITR
ncbi:MAG: hypothetical protein HLX51_13715 [Micrococcaceae bacterium]|nr:hypothetical protein [Micrococcaceae bacterium]